MVTTTTFDIVHTTQYDYSGTVSVSHHMARLTPRVLPHQTCAAHELETEPAAAVTQSHVDYFGNSMTFFAMQAAHRQLIVRARSTVTVSAPPTDGRPDGPPWEEATDRTTMPLDALECTLDRRFRLIRNQVADYARPSFPAGQPLLAAVADLTARIHAEFTYDPEATTVGTSLAQVLENRRGVCQDFAHLEIACLRSLGIPVRYVSGYLETRPAEGKPRLAGSDASHAWIAVHCPGLGWIDVDPTNNVFPSGTHITLAWGRDYADVSPTRGVILGGGEHSLKVSVDVTRHE